MYKILASSAIAFFILFGGVQAQEAAANERKILTEKAYVLFQQGKLDDAIKIAEKIVKLEKNSNQTDTFSYVNALVNLARMKRDAFLLLRNKLVSGKIPPSEREAAREKMSEIAKEAEEYFRQALQLNESGKRTRTAQTADIKSDLAWLVYNYIPTDGKPSVANTRARIDEAEKLFVEAIALNDQIRGTEADETLFVVLGAGNFYLNYHNFEKALPYYERYLQTNEKTHGKNHPNLVNALRPYAKILFATFQDRESAAAVKRIEEISGQKENLPKDDLNFHLRSKDAVAFSMQKSTTSKKGFERIFVKVVVDENGKVVEAVAETKDKKLGEKAEQEISKWTVRPFAYNNVTRKMRGYLYYLEAR